MRRPLPEGLRGRKRSAGSRCRWSMYFAATGDLIAHINRESWMFSDRRSLWLPISLTVALLAAALAPASRAQHSPALDAGSSIDKAYDFLRWQMDRHHAQMKLGADPEFASYYPTGKLGDVVAVE